MGKSLLVLVFTVMLAGCAGDQSAPRSAADPHADLACATCHSGPQGERGRATVPATSCKSSGCHEYGGPEEVNVASVQFPHRGHAAGSAIQPSCAGCHTHESGAEPLEASVDACALCHLSEVTSADAQECRLCHGQSEHSELTSSGVTVAHSELPWLEIGCVRCHYDVSSGDTEVTGQPCRQCHQDMAELNERAVGRDLHPLHDGLTCTACHEANIHEVRAMSSVVDLVCSDCHTTEHGVDLEGGSWSSDLCTTCHLGVHSAQQRLVLGIRPDSGVTPSAKFLAGITCRSCHVPPEVQTTAPIRGRAEACAGCHPPEYERVLGWWEDGVRLRLGLTSDYLEVAEGQVGATSDQAEELLDQARAMIRLVRQGGGQHNLEMSDQLIRDAVARAQRAYAAAGRPAPPSPDLGRPPHMGLCSYCHYESTQMWNLRDMPEDFHRTVLGQPQ